MSCELSLAFEAFEHRAKKIKNKREVTLYSSIWKYENFYGVHIMSMNKSYDYLESVINLLDDVPWIVAFAIYLYA